MGHVEVSSSDYVTFGRIQRNVRGCTDGGVVQTLRKFLCTVACEKKFAGHSYTYSTRYRMVALVGFSATV